jgi:hypothetical protein
MESDYPYNNNKKQGLISATIHTTTTRNKALYQQLSIQQQQETRPYISNYPYNNNKKQGLISATRPYISGFPLGWL